MSEPTVRISRRVFLAAIDDAIDWKESLLATHDGVDVPGTGCCDGGERCEDYRRNAKMLASFRQSQAAVLRRKGR